MKLTDLCTIVTGIVSAIGTPLNAWILWRVTKSIPEKKEEEDRKANLLAGLAVLEKTRRTLPTFKYQYILQRVNEATRLAHYINNFSLVEQYINQAIQLENEAQTSTSQNHQHKIPNQRFFLANLAKLINDDSTLKEIKDTVNISILNEGIVNLYALSDEHIQKLYLLIFDNPILFPQTPNTSYPEKSIPTKDLPEKLYFVANYNPGILIGLEQVTENLTQLNFMITQWNSLIQRHQIIKEPTVQDMTTHIHYFLSFSASLYVTGVDGSLMYIKISMDHLKEYAQTPYRDHKSIELEGKSFTLVEALMPELDEAAKKIKENLDSMRIN